MKHNLVFYALFFVLSIWASSCRDQTDDIGPDQTNNHTLVPPSSYCDPLVDYIEATYPSSVVIDSVLQLSITPLGATEMEVFEVHLSNGVWVYFLVSDCSFLMINCNCPQGGAQVCYNGQSFENECYAYCAGAEATEIQPGPCSPCGCPNTMDAVCYNNETYNNACLALCAGAQQWQIVPGACNNSCVNAAIQSVFAGTNYTIQSITTNGLGQYTVLVLFGIDDVITVRFDPNCGYLSACGCPSTFTPVCNTNTNTNYLNQCEALCAGASMTSIVPGFCP